MEIEQKNLEIINQNSEINKRYNDLKVKEMYLKDKYEDYQRIKNIVEIQEKKNIQYEKDLNLAGERIIKYADEITEKENYIIKEKNELFIKNNEMKDRQKTIEEEKNNIEQQKAELNLRYQYLNTFSYKSPIIRLNDFNMNNNNFNFNHNINKNDNYKEMDFDYTNNNFKEIINGGNYRPFNANRYISTLKDRIENGKKIYYDKYPIKENKLDIAEERLYLKKSNNELKKSWKN